MLRKLSRLTRLESPQRLLILQAVCGVAAARLGLLMLPMALVRRMLSFALRAGVPLGESRRSSAEAVIRAVTAAARNSPAGTTCLATALVGRSLLRRHGYDSQLRIGVRRGDKGDITAHAWLERNGSVIVGGPVSFVEMYTPLPRLEHLIP